MTTRLSIAVSVLVGIAVGATAVGGLRAQGKAPVYVVAVFSEISDPAAFGAASKNVPASIAASGGKLVARSDAVTALDTSTPPKRLAIFSFESADKARAWLRSDAMNESEAARAKLTKSGVYMVEGMAN